MKQKLLLLLVMLLSTMGTWAKDVRVQVTDARSVAVNNLPITFMYEQLETDDDGYFTAKGLGSAGTYQFTYQRNNETKAVNFSWDGANSVKVMLDGNWIVFALKDLTENEKREFSSISLSEHDDGYMKGYYPIWNESDKWGLFWDAATLYYRTDNSSLFGETVKSDAEINVANLSGDIVLDPKAGKQKLTFVFKDKDGNPMGGRYNFSLEGGYGIGGDAVSGLYFYRKIGARCTMNFGSNEYMYIQKKFVVGDHSETFTFDYTAAKKLTLKVLDTAGVPFVGCSVSFGWNGSSGNTNTKGEYALYSLDGEYSYNVQAEGYPSQEGTVTIAGTDVTQTVSYVGYRKISLKISDYKADTDLSISFEKEYNDTYAQKNDDTGLYEVVLKDGTYTYHILGNKTTTIEKEVVISKDEQFDISFKNFRHITFLAPVGSYSISDIKVYVPTDTGNYVYGNMGTDFYMLDGTYTWEATVTDTNSGTRYPANKAQEFTVSGQDRNVTYAFNPSDFLNLTFIVKDYAGQPMPYASVSVNSTSYSTDADGKVIVPVEAGDISYRVEKNTVPGTPYYLDVSGSVTVTNENVTKVISYEDAHSLTFELTGNSLPADYNPSVYMDHDRGSGGSAYIGLKRMGGDPQTYRGQIYVMDRESIRYNYRTEPYWSGMSDQKMTVTEDRTFKLEMGDYHKVTFTLNGKLFEDNYRVNVKTVNGEYVDSNCSFLPPGKYIASAQAHIDNSTIYLKEQPFTVTDAPVTINFAFNPNDYHKVNLSFLNFSDGMFGDIEFKSDSYFDECSSGSSSKYVYLLSGDYTYRVEVDNRTSNMSFPFVGTIRITDRDESLTIDANNFMHVAIVAKNPEGGLVKDALFLLEKDGLSEVGSGNNWEDEEEDVFDLFAPVGTYKLSISRAGYRTMSTNVTINASTQTLEYTLQKGNVTTVAFWIYDDRLEDGEVPGAKVTLAGYGTQTYKGGDGIIMFTDVAPADNLTYTVEAPGYNTLIGTLSVSLSGPYIDVEVDMTDQIVVGIENTTSDANKTFSVYPTTPADYVYIRSEVQEAGEWMAQLVSATGAVVYADKLLLDGETSVYVGNQPKGLYVLMLTKGSERMAFKILKK